MPQIMDNRTSCYDITHVQQGMLFHSLLGLNLGIYLQQFVCDFGNQLDLDCFLKAWHVLANQHEVFRTCFLWDSPDGQKQQVTTRVELPYRHFDWRKLKPTQQRKQFGEYLASDRRLGLGFDRAPLMRLAF